jgi:hypothetical protein
MINIRLSIINIGLIMINIRLIMINIKIFGEFDVSFGADLKDGGKQVVMVWNPNKLRWQTGPPRQKRAGAAVEDGSKRLRAWVDNHKLQTCVQLCGTLSRPLG